MKVYITVSDDVLDASKDLFENTHCVLDKQFDNVWVKQGIRVLEVLSERLSEEQFAEHAELVTEGGEEISPDRVAEILEQNNVIHQ